MIHTIKLSAGAVMLRFTAVLFCIACVLLLMGNTSSDAPAWVGKGKYRILVRVDPVDIHGRASDEMPTRIHIDTADVQKRTGAQGKIDVSSVEVEQYDPAAGKAAAYEKWAYAHADWELPFRWYDDSISEDFPEVVGNINPDTGELKYTPERNWGYFYETLGEWDGGNLAWTHTQRGREASYYAIYFNLLPPGKQPDALPRTGFVGDGTERVEEIGASTHGLLLSRVEVADWNGDGLPDIIVGGERGGVIWYPNRGTKQHPNFPYAKLMFTADGKPLDVGFSATPLVIDWDGDGIQDLVCGVEWNRAVWYKNIGSNAEPKLLYKGLIYTDDGKPFQLPHEPVPEIQGVYKTDYHPVLAAADMNGDGKVDVLAGGYVTGQIYLFENRGWNSDHTPILHFVGPLEADGQPLDVGWAAAPTAADVDGDGLIDIVTGDMPMTKEGGDSSSSENFLYYFKNVGTRIAPKFAKQKFPVKGKFPVGAIAAPRLVDLNGDGLLDLVVARDTDLSIYFNVGTKTSPLWEYAPPLPGKWHTSPLYGWGTQLVDWNGDGAFDLVHGFSVQLNLNKGNPQFFGPDQSILGPGEKIFHKSPTGDQWSFTYIADLDGDGKPDILYGVHQGWVYFHRNLSTGTKTKFDTEGVRLMMEDGNPIKVGPAPDHPWDFDVLQGARTTVAAADFDHDGKVDLIVGDTYGKVRYYRNLTGGANPTFAKPEVIADVGTRLVPAVADWNRDGWPDVIVGSNRAYVILNSGQRSGPRFLPAQPLSLAPGNSHAGGALEPIPGRPEWRESPGDGAFLPYESVVTAVDWNGDGDVDLLARASYGYLCWFERSFLEHGYAPAQVTAIAAR
jgi:FG-GAP-like repeat